MSEQQRRAPRPNRLSGGGAPSDEGSSLDATREELEGVLNEAERALNSVHRSVSEAQSKDQVPPGTFHGAGPRRRVA